VLVVVSSRETAAPASVHVQVDVAGQQPPPAEVNDVTVIRGKALTDPVDAVVTDDYVPGIQHSASGDDAGAGEHDIGRHSDLP
jgi:hypothetical protein